jgi:ketosteroid isomerase-like protein
MTDQQTDVAEVGRAAEALVRAFAVGDLDAYFASFVPDATFLFHGHPERIASTAAYRAVWDGWVRDDGFRVLEAASTAPHIQLVAPDVAVFTHRVRTVIETHEGSETLHERETIVFVRQSGGRWLGAHEHLSVNPQPDLPTAPATPDLPTAPATPDLPTAPATPDGTSHG